MAITIKKLEMVPAYREISNDLREQIMDRRIGLGEALPTESTLSELYGVNRSTVREGLRQLEQEGLLQRDGKRLLVSVPSSEVLADAAGRALRMQQVTLRYVWLVAGILEPLCAKLAALNATEADIKALEDNLERTQTVVKDGCSPVEVDIEFQNLVAQAAHNPALSLSRAPMSQLMHAGYSAIAPALPQSGARLLAIHKQLVTALKNKDPEAAEQAMQKHMKDYERGCTVAGLDMSQTLSHRSLSLKS